MPVAAVKPLEPYAEALLAEAHRRTDLEGFGPERFDTPLRILVNAMREESNLSNTGMQAQLEEIVSHLCTSLRTQKFFAENPEIEEQKIVAPVVIVGLQRTGTSKLFRNIAADRQWNVLFTWLGLNPAPFDGWQPGQPDQRIAEAEAWCADRQWMAKAHGYYPTAPEMEALLMKHCFMLNSPYRLVPSHQKWLEQADFSAAYRYLKRQLQFLQWQTQAPEGKRWILKSPPHLLTLNALTSVFPDARLIMTHRHPKSSVGSMFKLVELAQQNQAKFVDRNRIRELWLRNLSLATSRFMEFRDQSHKGQFVDVTFRDLVSDPTRTIKKIYDFVDAPYTSESEASIKEWHLKNPRHSEGKFEYNLEDFGLTDADIELEFHSYIDAYSEYL